jgi:hypothetical protein
MRQSDRGAELTNEDRALPTPPDPENGMCLQSSFLGQKRWLVISEYVIKHTGWLAFILTGSFCTFVH